MKDFVQTCLKIIMAIGAILASGRLEGATINVPFDEVFLFPQRTMSYYIAPDPAKDDLAAAVHYFAQGNQTSLSEITVADLHGTIWSYQKILNNTNRVQTIRVDQLQPANYYQIFHGAGSLEPRAADPILDDWQDSFAFKIPLQPGVNHLYLKVKVTSLLSVNPIISKFDQGTRYYDYTRKVHIWLQGFVGSLLFVVFIWAIILKKPVYYLYCFHLVLLILMDFNLGGMGWNAYLPEVGYKAPFPAGPFYLVVLIGANSVLFSMVFFELKTYSPRLFRYQLGLLAIYLAISLYGWPHPVFADWFLAAIFLYWASCILGAMVSGIRRKFRPAYFYSLSWMTFMIGVSFGLLLPLLFGKVHYFWGTLSLALGACAESILLAVALADKVNMDRQKAEKNFYEMEATQTVQNALMPKHSSLAMSSLFHIEAHYQPAEYAGGDWYGCQFHEESQPVFLQMCDVTGHGIPSSVITGVISGVVLGYHQRLALGSSVVDHEIPKDMLQTVNQVIMETGSTVGRLASMVSLSVHLRSGRCTVAGAGHPCLYRFSPRGVKAVSVHGSILGMRNDAEFSINEFTLEKGEGLLVYTDGLIENRGPNDAAIRRSKLRRVLQKSDSLEDAKRRIVNLTAATWQDVPQEDDVCFLLFKVS